MPDNDDEFSAASGGRLTGTNSLQQIVDKLPPKSVDDLTKVVGSMAKPNSNGTSTLPTQGTYSGNTSITTGSMASAPGTNGGYYTNQYTGPQPFFGTGRQVSSGQLGSMQGNYNYNPANQGFRTGNYGYSINQARVGDSQLNQMSQSVLGNPSSPIPPGTFGDPVDSSNVSSPTPMSSSGNGGYGPPSGAQGGPGTPVPGNGGTGSGGFLSGLGGAMGGARGASIGGGIGALAGAAANAGSSNLNAQVGMSAYNQQAMLGVAPGMGNQSSALYNQAFGTYNNNLNRLALNPLDAAQGQLTMNYMASSPFPSSTGIGRAGQTTASGTGYLIPGLGYQGSAQMASQLYNPTTSLAMRALGYPSGASPRAALNSGNSSQGLGQVIQGMLGRWYGNGTKGVSSSTLNASLGQGGRGELNLQSLGLDPTQWNPVLQGYNKLFQQGVSPTQANQLFQTATSGSTAASSTAQKTLNNKYGIPDSDFQLLKNSQAIQTGRQSGMAPGFNQGLGQATTLLNKFNEALNNILNGPAGHALGYAQGASAAARNAPGSGAGASILGGAGGGFVGALMGAGAKAGVKGVLGYGVKKGVKGILGKFGGGAGDAAAGAEGTAAEAGAADAAAGSGLGFAGALASVAAPLGAGVAAWEGIQHGGQILGAMGLHNVFGLGSNPVANSINQYLTAHPNMSKSDRAHYLHILHEVEAGGSTAATPSELNQLHLPAGGAATPTMNFNPPGVAGTGTSPSKPTGGAVSGQVNMAVHDALAQVGKPYVWGGDSPATSFDCSGLVKLGLRTGWR